MTSPVSPQSVDPRRRQARARAWMAAVWALGATASGVLLLVAGQDDDGSRIALAMGMLGLMLLVGSVVAFALIATNASLTRRPDRDDARGISDLLTVATALVAVAAVALVVITGSPEGLRVVPLVLAAVVYFGLLLGICQWTRSAAARRGVAIQAQP